MSHKRNEALRHVQHSMHHVIAAGEGSDRAPDSCKLCPYYRPDFKFRTCLYAHCPYKKQVNVFRSTPEKWDIFNHHTNVDINNRIVCFDIKQLGKQLKKLGMLIVQDAVWGRVTANRSAGKSTRYYADEFHLLLKEEQTAAYSVEIWKRFRKWGGIPTALTQNVKDLLASPEVSNIFENSDFVYMLNQANGDRQILAKQLNISPHQLSYVTHSGEGEGLLFFGNVILPFVDHFPKDLELYRILTTKLNEISEGAQK